MNNEMLTIDMTAYLSSVERRPHIIIRQTVKKIQSLKMRRKDILKLFKFWYLTVVNYFKG